MSKHNYWLKNGLINIAQNLLTVLFGVVSLYLLVRSLSKDQYGTWVLFLTTVSIIEIGRNGLTQEAIIKYLSAANRVDARKINTAALIINFSVTALIIIVLLIIGPYLANLWHSTEINHMFHLYSVVLFFSAFVNQINCIEQANLNFSGVFYSNVVRQLIFLSFILYVYLNHGHTNVIELTYVQILSVVVAAFVAIIHTRKKLKFTLRIDWDWIKKIFHFGKYTFGVTLTSMIAGSIDQMMLASTISKSASASFNIAVRIANFTEIPSSAMATILYPQSAKKVANEGNESIKYLYEKSVGVILSILIPALIFFFFLSGPIIHFLAGGKYDDSVPLLKIMLFSYFFSPFSRQTGTVLSATGNTKLNFYLLITTISTIVISNYFLMKHFGAPGAAYAMVLSSVIGFFVAQYFLIKYFKINAFNCLIYAVKFYPEFLHKYILKRPLV